VSSPWEILANVFNAASILLARRNSVHTWWVGIVGCAFFICVFWFSKLYADVSLQIFFIVTSVYGWRNWLHGEQGAELPVRRSRPSFILGLSVVGLLIALGYGWLLHRFTDAYAPFWDSAILTFSVISQFLLMGRRFENWWGWLIVNTIAVPLYASRGLYLTSILYAGFWINAIVALRQWRRLLDKSKC
jgi:nicotinamide mononucleotide transporter